MSEVRTMQQEMKERMQHMLSSLEMKAGPHNMGYGIGCLSPRLVALEGAVCRLMRAISAACNTASRHFRRL